MAPIVVYSDVHMKDKSPAGQLGLARFTVLGVFLLGLVVAGPPAAVLGQDAAPVPTPIPTEKSPSQGIGKPRPDPPTEVPVVTHWRRFPWTLKEWQLKEVSNG